MTVQVLTGGDSHHGTFQHALMLARALVQPGCAARLVALSPPVAPLVRRALGAAAIEWLECGPAHVPPADVHVVVGLWQQPTAEAATRLVRAGRRVVLVPTTYWPHDMLPDLRGRAEALWYVSWDQASDARPYWHLAERVEVVPCAVDVERFRPSGRRPNGRPWVLCRHSRDASEKFPAHPAGVLERLGARHPVVLRVLGGAGALARLRDERIEALAQDAVDPALFLRGGDVWLYDHAPWWRETACVAMLEAMACGLPVVVRAGGGMREYLRHGRTGFACAGDDEFERFTRLLFEQPLLYAALAGAAREFVSRRHSLDSLRRRVSELLADG